MVILLVLCRAKSIFPGFILAQHGASREGASEAILTESTPGLKDELEIGRVVIDVVVGEENSFGGILRVRPQLLIQTIDRRLSISNIDAVFRRKPRRRVCVQVIPNHHNLM
jgi:hypothetical protein